MFELTVPDLYLRYPVYLPHKLHAGLLFECQITPKFSIVDFQQHKLWHTISNNIEVYKEQVLRTKKIPYRAVKFEAGEENRIIHESLHWMKTLSLPSWYPKRTPLPGCSDCESNVTIALRPVVTTKATLTLPSRYSAITFASSCRSPSKTLTTSSFPIAMSRA